MLKKSIGLTAAALALGVVGLMANGCSSTSTSSGPSDSGPAGDTGPKKDSGPSGGDSGPAAPACYSDVGVSIPRRGIGVRDRVGRDVAAGSALVLDHHRLAPDLLQAVADETRGDVGRAARRERHHDAYGFCRPVGTERPRRKNGRCSDSGGETEKAAATGHGWPPSGA